MQEYNISMATTTKCPVCEAELSDTKLKGKLVCPKCGYIL